VTEYFVQSIDQRPVKDGVSQFHNIHVNLQKFHIVLLDYNSWVRLSQVLCMMSSENGHGCT
jgi:hypothetical protein